MTKTVFATPDEKFYEVVKNACAKFCPSEPNALAQIKSRVQEDHEEYLEEQENEFMEFCYKTLETPESFTINSFSKYTKTEIPDEGIEYALAVLRRNKYEIY